MIAPSASVSSTVIAQVQPVAEPEAVLGEFSMAAPESEKAHAGAVVTSVLEVNARDTTSAVFALPDPLVEIAGVPRVGWVLSIVTEPDPEVTATPAFPFASPKEIE